MPDIDCMVEIGVGLAWFGDVYVYVQLLFFCSKLPLNPPPFPFAACTLYLFLGIPINSTFYQTPLFKKCDLTLRYYRYQSTQFPIGDLYN